MKMKDIPGFDSHKTKGQAMKSRKRSRKNLDARIMQIMGLALRVNRETKHSVFVEFSGHVDALMVSASVGGYKSEEYPDYSQIVWLKIESDVFARLSEIRAKLNSLLRDKK